jgi:hypothetical protein
MLTRSRHRQRRTPYQRPLPILTLTKLDLALAAFVIITMLILSAAVWWR